jgi:hypothetical protein
VRRREFITLLVGTAAWPLAARAQHHDRVRRIGVLMAVAENDPESQFRVNALEAGLRELGWMEGRNLRIEYRWAPAYRGPRHLPEKAKGGAVDVAPACNNYGASMPCTRPLKVCRAGPRVRTSGDHGQKAACRPHLLRSGPLAIPRANAWPVKPGRAELLACQARRFR